MRLKWCVQASAAFACCHARGDYYCDLRPENMLLDAELDLSFCDLNSSRNADYDGDGLPDFGFFDPRLNTFNVTTRTETPGPGPSTHTIPAGHPPHRPPTLKTAEERINYTDTFESLVLQNEFPDTSRILAGDIGQDCRKYNVRSAEEARHRLIELNLQLQHQRDET